MDRVLDYITKKLWSKNYPRTLIIFNINNVGQVVAGIFVLICSFLYPTEGYYGNIMSALLILVPILGTIIAILNQEIYEWIVAITHLINVFFVVPLYFCTMGTVYGLGLVMFVLTVIQSYVLIKNILAEIIVIAIQNTIYATLIILSFYTPQYFINYATPGIQTPIFYYGIAMASFYIAFLARIFVYVFKLDYENTIRITENLETLDSMDSLTGAYNKEAGLSILQTLMNDSWNNNNKFSISLLEVDSEDPDTEENKYISDLILVNAFDACRDILPADSLIVRYDKKCFLLVLPDCSTVSQVDTHIVEINTQFALLKQAAKLENGSLKFGRATILHGMTMEQFLSRVEENLVARREK